MEDIIRFDHVQKRYNNKPILTVLRNVSFKIQKESFYVIQGTSGAGKSTLLNLIGLLDTPTAGSIYLNDRHIESLNEKEKAYLRMKNFGFIFQEFYLNETLRAYENVMIPMFINPCIPQHEIEKRSYKLLKLVGLEKRATHYPKQLSGGEKQRVAIARALANNPLCILADEPTGSLDPENETIILRILKQLSEQGKAIVAVSHGQKILDYGDRVFVLDKGELEERYELEK